MSQGRHVRRSLVAVVPQRRGVRRLLSPVVVFAVGFVLASAGAASGYFTTSGSDSGQVQAVTLTTPGAGSATSPTTTSLDISWGASSGLPTGGGYEVSRSTTSGGPYSPVSSGSCDQAITKGSSATSCTDDDSALVPGTTYYYVVEAVYDNGTTTWTSGQTAEFSGTLLKVTPEVTTAADPPSLVVGGSADDQATISGLYTPTSGTITWKLYDNGSCSGTPVFTSATQHVTADTTYTSNSFTTTGAGSFTWGFSYSGDTHNAAVTGCGGTDETLGVDQATPSLGTSADTDVAVGQSVSDMATLASGYNPTGTITYTLYGPSSTPSCTTQVGQVSAEVSGNGAYTSPAITPTEAGTYWWIANYGGDTDNTATTNGCDATGESSIVNPLTPTIVTTATPSSVTVGGSVADQSVLSGSYSATGTITWSLYAGSSCTGTPVFTTSTGGTVSGDNTYTSNSHTMTSAGTYTWDFSYSGDVNNNPVSLCGGSGQTLTVNQRTPTITTSANPNSVTVGHQAADTATFSGLYSPASSTATITWALYPSADTSCSGTPVFTSAPQGVTANTTYTSTSFTTTNVGTYTWGFSYSGDANNGLVTGCGGNNESLTVNTATPGITTSAAPAIATVGDSVADTASFTNLYNPASSTGTITWSLYDNGSCNGTAVFTSTPQSVTANTTYTSSSFTTTTAGSYTWGFAYSGDADNSPVNGCGGANESLTVS